MPTAFITGASAGIGRCYAQQLAASGHDLILTARRADRLQAIGDDLASRYGIGTEIIAADLGGDDGAGMLERRIRDGDPIDLVVNNAAFPTKGPVADLDFAALDAMLRVNVVALARLSHAAMYRMTRAGKGAIINVASGTAFRQMLGNAGYGASKSFVVALTRHMQAEARGSGVYVQLLIPGAIATGFHALVGGSVAQFPPERVMQADDLVAASLHAAASLDPVCIPSLPDIKDWDAYVAAEARLTENTSRDRVATRYRD
ncbi:MAG TPA: SDR family NAD(P)-dependent oxidoreductase [Allosphingosinicella sp.]|nr:SDR family NAD(P)-dependent oxidoreductase [Allosphingosinicella sp.]